MFVLLSLCGFAAKLQATCPTATTQVEGTTSYQDCTFNTGYSNSVFKVTQGPVSLTIIKCIFQGISTNVEDGSLVLVRNSGANRVSFDQCTFTDCEIMQGNGTVLCVTNATAGSDASDDAIEFSSCTFSNLRAPSIGYAIYSGFTNKFALARCTFHHFETIGNTNSPGKLSGSECGIVVADQNDTLSETVMVVSDCTFDSNTFGGSCLVCRIRRTYLDNCTFSNNQYNQTVQYSSIVVNHGIETFDLANSIFTNNSHIAKNTGGGSISTYIGTKLIIKSCYFNSGTKGYEIAFRSNKANNPTVTIVDCNFKRNSELQTINYFSDSVNMTIGFTRCTFSSSLSDKAAPVYFFISGNKNFVNTTTTIEDCKFDVKNDAISNFTIDYTGNNIYEATDFPVIPSQPTEKNCPTGSVTLDSDGIYKDCSFTESFDDSVFQATSNPVTLILKNCKFTGIITNSTEGSIVYVKNSGANYVTFDLCTFDNCEILEGRGCVFGSENATETDQQSDDVLFFLDCTFSDLRAPIFGYAIYSTFTNKIILDRCTFHHFEKIGNVKKMSTTANCGVVVATNNDTSIETMMGVSHCTFDIITFGGNCLVCRMRRTFIDNCTFTNNVFNYTVTFTSICVNRGLETLECTHCVFKNNSQIASNTGGSSFAFYSGNSYIIDCEFDNGNKGFDVSYQSGPTIRPEAMFIGCKFTRNSENAIFNYKAKNLNSSLTVINSCFKSTITGTPRYFNLKGTGIPENTTTIIDGCIFDVKQEEIANFPNIEFKSNNKYEATSCDDTPLPPPPPPPTEDCPTTTTQVDSDASYHDCTFGSSFTSSVFQAMNNQVTLHLTNCKFEGINTDSETGSIVFVRNAAANTIIFDQCSFSNCRLYKGNGTAFSTINATAFDAPTDDIVEFTKCTFNSLISPNGYAIQAAFTAKLSLDHCTFLNFVEMGSEKVSGPDNGVIVATQNNTEIETTLTLNSCTFDKVTYGGSCVLCRLRDAVIDNCTFTNNEFKYTQGYTCLCMHIGNKDIKITSSTFTNNSQRANTAGGASLIMYIDGSLYIKGCNFNSGDKGHEIAYRTNAKFDFTAKLENCSFVRNSADKTFKYGTITLRSKQEYIGCDFKCTVEKDNSVYILIPTKVGQKLENTTAVFTSCSFDCAKEQVPNFDTATFTSCTFGDSPSPPDPDVTNAPQPGTCPLKVPISFSDTADYSYSDCNYIAGSRLFKFFPEEGLAEGPSLTMTKCTFTNIVQLTTKGLNGDGGSVFYSYGRMIERIHLIECTFTKCYTPLNIGGIAYIDGKVLNHFIMERCTITESKSNRTGAAIYIKGCVEYIVDGCTVTNSGCELTNTEGGVFYSGPASNNQGTGKMIIRNSVFTKNHRCITAKVLDLEVTNTKFDDCYSLNTNSYGNGGAIYIPSNVNPDRVYIYKNTFTNNEAEATGSKGGSIYIAYAVDIVVKSNTFTKCTATYGGAVYIDKAKNTVLIDRNVFSQGNSDIYFSYGIVTVSNNKFNKARKYSPFYGQNLIATFDNNCFKEQGTSISTAHYIVVYNGSTVTINDNNCFDHPKDESVGIRNPDQDAPSKFIINGSPFSCTQCNEIPEEAQEEPSKGSGIPTTTVIGIVVAIVVIVIIIIVVIVCYKKKSKDASDGDEGDYNNIPEETEGAI